MKHICAVLHDIVTSRNLKVQEDYIWFIEDVQAPCDQLAHSIYHTLSNPLQGDKECMPNFLKNLCNVSY
jgi:hypothetical protein